MPLALIAVLLVPLGLAPVWSARLEREALEHERRQIAFDNGAIVLGRAVRAALVALAAAERTLEGAEVGHHALHACASVNPKCRVPDLLVEQFLRATHRAAEAAFRAALAAAPPLATLELGRATGAGRVEAPRLSLTSMRCPICRLPIRWRLRLGDGAVVENGPSGRRRVVRWERGSRWDYRIVWSEVAGAFSWN